MEENIMDRVDEQAVEGVTTEPTVASEDIFNEIFGQAQEQVAPVGQEVVEGEPTETQTAMEPKNDPDQFQYWQSQADKRAAEVDMLKSQMAEVMTKVNQPTQAAPVEKETVLEKPVKPRKPADFDRSEALTDPDSASAQYLAKQESYLEAMSEYVASSNDRIMQTMTKAQQEQQAIARDQKVMQDLQSKYNYTPQQASDFVAQMSSPDSLSLDNLVQLHQLRMNNGSQQVIQVTPEAQQKAAVMNQRNEKLSIPKPIGVQPGASDQSPTKNIEDKMMDAMIGNFNKRNPF
jgi:flagellar biosynthesis regulator FlaF